MAVCGESTQHTAGHAQFQAKNTLGAARNWASCKHALVVMSLPRIINPRGPPMNMLTSLFADRAFACGAHAGAPGKFAVPIVHGAHAGVSSFFHAIIRRSFALRCLWLHAYSSVLSSRVAIFAHFFISATNSCTRACVVYYGLPREESSA